MVRYPDYHDNLDGAPRRRTRVGTRPGGWRRIGGGMATLEPAYPGS